MPMTTNQHIYKLFRAIALKIHVDFPPRLLLCSILFCSVVVLLLSTHITLPLSLLSVVSISVPFYFTAAANDDRPTYLQTLPSDRVEDKR
jgi:hypothetical protein